MSPWPAMIVSVNGRLVGAILAALCTAAVVVGAGGCTASSGGNGPAPAASVSRSLRPSGPSGSTDSAARDRLVAAVNLTRSATARFSLSTLTGGLPTLIGNGITDGPRKRVEGSLADPANRRLTAQFIAVGADLYVKLDPPLPGTTAGKWTHIDATRAKSLTALGVDPSDPTGLGRFAGALVSVQAADAGGYTGTVDATKVAPVGVTAARLRQLGAAASAAPFAATVDAAGRLTRLTIQLPTPGTGAKDSAAVYFDQFDQPSLTIAAPPAPETSEASASIYSLLGG